MAIFFFQTIDLVEFFKSFLLTVITIFIFSSSLKKPIYEIGSKNLLIIIKFSSLFIISFELFQVIEKLIFGSTNSWFYLDGFLISTATNSNRFQAANFLSFTRPISFYHEPSYLGIILLILLICGKQLRINLYFQLFIVFGIILSFSTTALVFLIFYFFMFNIKKIKLFFILSIITILLGLSFFDSETINNFIRLNEILNPGTSGNQRLIGPFDYLVNELFFNHHIFGIPLGQSNLVFNNSFYLLFLYFGFLTPVILLLLFYILFKKYGFDSIFYLIALFSLLFLNGAIFTMEDAFILYFLNTTFYIYKSYIRI